MTFPLLALKWPRCPDGVVIAEASIDGQMPRRFQYKTASREYRLNETVSLSSTVAMSYFNAKDERGLTSFFKEFGFFVSGEWPTISVENALEHQAHFRLVLVAALGGASAQLPGALSAIVDNVQLEGFTYDKKGDGLGLALRATTLLDFMKMEIFAAASSGVSLAFCERCGKGVLTGHNTGAKSHMKYCSNACRVAASRARQKAAEGR